MLVTKHGNWQVVETTKAFECETCECRFFAILGEYKKAPIKRPSQNGPKYYIKYEARCPECGHFSELLEPIENLEI